MSKTWKITVDENELKALISFHGQMLAISGDTSTERSARIHDLTKRLNKKDEPEIEKEEPQPEVPYDRPVPQAWG